MARLHSFIQSWNQKDKTEKLYMAGGAFALILALIGVLFPVVPQVPFAILAAYLFSKSNPEFHRRIRKSKLFGRSVRDWEDERVVRPKLKALSIAFMVAGAAVAHWQFPFIWALVTDAAFIGATIFLLFQKSHA